jgi:hypothetical protein
MRTQLQTWGVRVEIGAALVAGGPVWAATDAVKIAAFSDGRGIAPTALHAIRQVVGRAGASGIMFISGPMMMNRGGAAREGSAGSIREPARSSSWTWISTPGRGSEPAAWSAP